jgi:hypothetical protein
MFVYFCSSYTKLSFFLQFGLNLFLIDIKLACGSQAVFLVALSIRSKKLLIGIEVSFGSPQGAWVKSWVRSRGGGGVWLSEPVL